MPSLSMLKEIWTRHLACPRCSGSLRHEDTGRGPHLECTLCTTRYPVLDNIPSFVEVTGSDQTAEIVQRDKEAASYEGNFLAWETYLEVMPLLRDLAPKPTDVILDVGAGTGRFVREYIRDVGLVVAVDHSLESLRYMRRSIDLVAPAARKLVPIHADACALPFRSGTFDAVVSVGMLQHLPSDDHRLRAISGMARAIRAEGRCVLQARHWSRVHAFHDQRRGSAIVKRLAELLIGNADGGIELSRVTHHAQGTVAIHNISSEELRSLAERAGLDVERVVGRLICAKGMQRLGVIRPVLERAIERTPLSLLAAQEVVAVGRRSA